MLLINIQYNYVELCIEDKWIGFGWFYGTLWKRNLAKAKYTRYKSANVVNLKRTVPGDLEIQNLENK